MTQAKRVYAGQRDDQCPRSDSMRVYLDARRGYKLFLDFSKATASKTWQGSVRMMGRETTIQSMTSIIYVAQTPSPLPPQGSSYSVSRSGIQAQHNSG